MHDPTKTVTLKQQCAGNSKKVIRFDTKKEKIYFISAHDRSVIIEIDLKSMEMRTKERKYKYGKIIDFVLSNNDTYLVTLNKDGWVEFKDLNKPDPKPKVYKKKNKVAGQKDGAQKSDDEDADIHANEDYSIQLAKGSRLSI